MNIRTKPKSDETIDELARVLFAEDERMLPEGRTWEGLDPSDRAFYRNGVRAVLRRLEALQREG